MYKIAIISAYFGHLPNYIKYWMYSAEINSSIDFFIINDQKPIKHPQNVHFIRMSLDDFSTLASQKINLPIHLKDSYKCCDFKCAYGLIFEDYLKEYDFWGHCDLDLVWGDLRCFLNEKVLGKYEKIYSLGHLSLYRNTEQMKRAFMLSGSEKGDYMEVFTDEKHYAFDELRGIYLILKKNNISQYDKYEFADISPVFRRMKIVSDYTCYDNNYNHQIFIYKAGRIERYYLKKNREIGKDEFAYLHFQKRKYADNQLIAEPSQTYVFTANGFIPLQDGLITEKVIRKYNKYPGRLYEWLEWKDRNHHIIRK